MRYNKMSKTQLKDNYKQDGVKLEMYRKHDGSQADMLRKSCIIRRNEISNVYIEKFGTEIFESLEHENSYNI